MHVSHLIIDYRRLRRRRRHPLRPHQWYSTADKKINQSIIPEVNLVVTLACISSYHIVIVTDHFNGKYSGWLVAQRHSVVGL